METFNPSAEAIQGSAQVLSKLRGRRVGEVPKLVTKDSQAIELPAELAKVFELIALDFAAGKAVTVVAHEARMTTQQAADFLAVSRPTLIKLLSDYRVPFETIGRHRKISFANVSDLQMKIKAKREAALASMAREDQASGALEATSKSNPLIRK